MAERQGTGLQSPLRRSEPDQCFQYSPDSTNFHPRVAQSRRAVGLHPARRGSEALLADHIAPMAELADALVSETSAFGRESSTLSWGTSSSQLGVVVAHSLRTVVAAVRFRQLAPSFVHVSSNWQDPGLLLRSSWFETMRVGHFVSDSSNRQDARL